MVSVREVVSGDGTTIGDVIDAVATVMAKLWTVCTNGFCSPVVGTRSSSIDYTGTCQNFICLQNPSLLYQGMMGSPSLNGHRLQSSMEKSLLSLWQFEEACDELWAWLTDSIWQLGYMEPIAGGPDAVAAQLSKHKVTVMLAVV